MSPAEVSSSVRLVPLGGLGEVGMNCLAIDAEGEILVIDVGMTFPTTSAARSLDRARRIT